MIPEERDPFTEACISSMAEVQETIIAIAGGSIRDVTITNPEGGTLSFQVPRGAQWGRHTSSLTPLSEAIEDVADFIRPLSSDFLQPFGTNICELGTFTIGDVEQNNNSVESGRWETASSLREEEDSNDTWGTESDPGAMGYAETWFRKCLEEKIGDQS
jgi:hypothetical protein